MRKKQIVIIGSSDDTVHDDTAYVIGAFIASNSWILITAVELALWKQHQRVRMITVVL